MGFWGSRFIFISCLIVSVNSAAESLPFSQTQSMFGAGDIRVPCEIHGQSFSDCKVDTGAVVGSVKKNIFTSPYEIINKVSVSSVSGAENSCDVTIVPLTFASEAHDKSLVMVCDQLKSTGVDVILGADVLLAKPIIFNFKNQNLEINAAPPAAGLSSFTMDEVGHILLPLKISRQIEAKAMFDSGASVTLVDRAFVESHPESFTVVRDDTVTDTHGNTIGSKLVITSLVEVGEIRFVAEYMMAVDLSAAKALMGQDVNFILGHNLTKSGNWYFSKTDKLWKAVPLQAQL